jgi:hypothetical protein
VLRWSTMGRRLACRGRRFRKSSTGVARHEIDRRLEVLGSWAFTGAHLVEYVSLLTRLVERFDLPRLVTPYALADQAVALRDVADGAVMKAVLTAR